MTATEKPAENESGITAIKSQAINKLSAVAKITSLVKPAEKGSFDDQAQYESKLNSVLEEMPTLNNASAPQADSENQIHGIQADEMAEGHALAKLRKLSLENEKFISSTQTAYASCAERSDLAQPVRAVCFMRAMEISIKLNNPQRIVGLNVPADVRRLALQLVN